MDRLSRPAWWVIWAAVGAGFLLRVHGLHFGEGVALARPDEEIFAGVALRMSGGSLDPSWRRQGWPDGFFLVHHLAQRALHWFVSLRYGADINLGCLSLVQPDALYLPVRALSAALGALTAIPAALVARRLARPEASALAACSAALILAANYLHGRDSHFAVSDAALAFLCAWTLWGAVVYSTGGAALPLAVAAACAGLACGVKWHGLFLLPVLLAALLLQPVARARRALACSSLLIAGFAIASPFSLLHPREAIAGLLGHAVRYASAGPPLAEPGAHFGRGLWFHLRTTLPIAFGWFGFVSALAGMVLALRQRSRAALTVLACVASLFVASVGPTRLLFVRYCLPIIPVFAALSGAALGGLALWVRKTWQLKVPASALLAPLLVCACATPGWRLFRVGRLLAQTDTRELARRWLDANAGGAAVLPLGHLTGIHAVDPAGTAACNASLPPALRRPVPALACAPRDWTGLLQQGPAGWAEINLRASSDRVLRARPLADGPAYVVRGEALIRCGRAVPGDLIASPLPDPRCYREVARFEPGSPGCDAIHDAFDTLYLPYRGFSGIARPGPRVIVYRNQCK